MSDVPQSERRSGWWSDIALGSLVAVVGAPQCVAYAMMVGLAPAVGLASAIVVGLVAAILGQSRFAVAGPTNATALMVLAALSTLPAGAPTLPMLATLGLLAGAWRLVLAVTLGQRLVELVPTSVLAGFTTGAGLLIAVMQLDDALGLDVPRTANAIHQLHSVGRAAISQSPNWSDAIFAGATVMLIVVGGLRWSTAILTLVAIVAGIGLSLLGGAEIFRVTLIGDVMQLPNGWPTIVAPTFDLSLWRELLIPSLAIACVSVLELMVAVDGEKDISSPREIAAHGVANIAGALLGGMPSSASLARSKMLSLGNATSRIAPLTVALVTVPMLFGLKPFLERLPLATLAGVLMAIGVRMVKLRRIQQLWESWAETRWLFVLTCVATLTLRLHEAIMLGVVAAAALHLLRRPQLHVQRSEGRAIVGVDGPVHFSACASLERALSELDVPVIHLDMKHAHGGRIAIVDALVRVSQFKKLRVYCATKRLHQQLIAAGVASELCAPPSLDSDSSSRVSLPI